MKPVKTSKPLPRAAILVVILIAVCAAAAAIYYLRYKPKTVWLGEYSIPKFSDSKSVLNEGAWLEPGSLALWNGQAVYISSTESHVLVKSLIDDKDLAVIPAQVLRGIPPVQAVVDDPKLYILFYDEFKGWCIAVCEGNTEPHVTAILPGNTFTWQGKWTTSPGWKNTISFGVSDFQLVSDRSLEGVVGVKRYKKDEYYKDPEEEIAAYFWFRYKDGQVKFSWLGEYMGPLDFQIMPSLRGSASAFIYCSRGKLFYREASYDNGSNIVLSPELSLGLHIPSRGKVRGFEIIPPLNGEPDELRVLMNTYSYLGYDRTSQELRFGKNAWTIVIIDRTSFTEKSRIRLLGCGGFSAYPSQRYPNVLTRQGNWLILDGHEIDGLEEYVLAINLSNHLGYPLRVKAGDGLPALGFCQYPGNRLAFGYLGGWGLDESAEEKIILYELILPNSG